MLTISGYMTLSNFIIYNPIYTISEIIYMQPSSTSFLDHNYFRSTGIYGSFYKFDYLDISKSIITKANVYIQRDLSISGNVYCSSLYNYINSQITQTYMALSGIITVDLNQYVKIIHFMHIHHH